VAVAVAAALGLLPSCAGRDDDGNAAPAVTTTVVAATSPAPSSSSTTTPAPATTVTSRVATTVATTTPEATARALFEAWTKGDRAAAGKVAQAAAVTALFARPWQASDGWTFAECNGAAGSLICTWQRPAGQQLLFRVQNLTGGLPVTVAEVRFQP
jgi:hypothetical protein